MVLETEFMVYIEITIVCLRLLRVNVYTL